MLDRLTVLTIFINSTYNYTEKTWCATPVLMCEMAETAIKNLGVEALAGWSRGFSRNAIKLSRVGVQTFRFGRDCLR